jgi:phage gpG-like protein
MQARVSVDTNMPQIHDDDMTIVMERIAQILLDGVREQFIYGGMPDTWRPLKNKQASYLFQSGALLRSIARTTGGDGGSYWAMVSTSGSLPYAFIHQFGGYAGRGGSAYIPPRPYMVVTEETEARIMQEAAGMLVEILNTEPKPQENRRGNND